MGIVNMFFGIPVSISELASFINLIISSAVIIVAFSLLAFTLTYNFSQRGCAAFCAAAGLRGGGLYG
ncbi:MAG: hypothetical protein R2911_37150 [Caldilineaceae bacterium]